MNLDISSSASPSRTTASVPGHYPLYAAGRSPRIAVIAQAADRVMARSSKRVTRTAKAHRENMREWRKKAKAKGVSKLPQITESPDHTCPLCLESFKTGAAYMNHFAERRFGEGELHVCMTRQQMRESANLVPDWDTGAWTIRR